jgi:predicted transposase/invertase (TIGR01784 family)
MPFRIIRYQIAIIQNHIEKYGETLPLPMVVPLVFYNGVRSPYPYSSNIIDLFDNNELFDSAKLGTFKLIDLTTMETTEIFKHGKVAVLEMLQKAVRVRDFKAIIETIIEVLLLGKASGLKQSLVDRGILYLFGARDVEEIKPLIEKIKQQIPNYGEEIMNFIDAMKLEGEQEAKQEIAQELIKSGIDESVIAKATHLSKSQIEEIKKSMH